MQRPQITIRLGASHDDISVDGHTFNRRDLSRYQRHFLQNKVIDGLVQTEAVAPETRKERNARWKYQRPKRKNKKAQPA